jgi:hypothetical protein
MSVYRLNKLFYRLETDRDYLERFRADPAAVAAEIDLTDDERSALLAGDVGKLYVMGCHGFLMNTLSRQGLLGVNRDNYLQRVRAAVGYSLPQQGS